MGSWHNFNTHGVRVGTDMDGRFAQSEGSRRLVHRPIQSRRNVEAVLGKRQEPEVAGDEDFPFHILLVAM
jgi:hypothetical protein